MQTADFNHNDFSERGNAADENLLVKFFYKTRPKKGQQPHETPKFIEVEYIEIRVAGSRDPQACRPATDGDRQRFPRHYAAFKQRVELPEEGYPLAEWTMINRSMVETLSFMNVKTVEQLANLNDTHVSGIMGGSGFKRKAQEWLKERNSNDSLAKENVELRAEMAEMQASINALINAQPNTESEPEAEPEPEPEAKTEAKTEVKKPRTTARRSRNKA